jgi:hypothetical protein
LTLFDILNRHIYKVLGKVEAGEKFLMNLHNGDVLQLQAEKSGLWRVTSISEAGQVFLKPVFDARPFSFVLKSGNAYSPTAQGLQANKATKPKTNRLGFLKDS